MILKWIGTLVCPINVQQNLLIFRIFPSYMSLFGATCLLIVSIKSYLHGYLDLHDFPTEALFFLLNACWPDLHSYSVLINMKIEDRAVI